MVNIEQLSAEDRLERICNVIEYVDNRCMTHATVSKTLEEMTQEEISEIYALAKGSSKYLKPKT